MKKRTQELMLTSFGIDNVSPNIKKTVYTVMSGEAPISRASCYNHQLQQLPLITQREYNDTREGDNFNWAGKGGKLARFERDETLPLEHCGEYLGFSYRTIVDKRIPQGCGNRRPLAYKQVKCDYQYLTIEDAWEEVKNMRGLNHPHVIRMVAACVQGNTLGILMYPPGPRESNLDDYMNSISSALQRSTALSANVGERFAKLPRFFVCLSEGLNYLHGLNIKHKDIKPSNIIVDAFGSPLITDFGISHRYLDASNAITEGVTKMTYDYASPEAARYKRRTLESDIFSLGAVFLDLLTLIVGRSLDQFCTFRQDRKDISFHNNLESVHEWITELEAIPYNKYPGMSFGNDNRQDRLVSTAPDMRSTFQHIRLMLSGAPEVRPKAADLPLHFHHACSFVCPDCDQRAENPYKPTIQDHPWAGDNINGNEEFNTSDAASPPNAIHTALPVNIGLKRENDKSDVDVKRTFGQEPSESTSTTVNADIRRPRQLNRRSHQNRSYMEQIACSEKLNVTFAHKTRLQQPASPLENSTWYRQQNLLIYDKTQHRLSRMPAAELKSTYSAALGEFR